METYPSERGRQSADARIGVEVGRLNTALAQVDQLNHDIAAERAAGKDIAPLLDQRQALVDGIAAIVPLREVARACGFAELSPFYRAFRRWQGGTPRGLVARHGSTGV